MNPSAILSDCGKFCYRLSRTWDDGIQSCRAVFVMLNPSTADAEQDDPTIRKCIGFARRWGAGGIDVVNLYAYRATDPADLKAAGRPVGPENDRYIDETVVQPGDDGWVICAWGVNAKGLERPAKVLARLGELGVKPCALRLTATGIPWHPLMLPYSAQPFAFPSGVKSPTERKDYGRALFNAISDEQQQKTAEQFKRLLLNSESPNGKTRDDVKGSYARQLAARLAKVKA